MSAYEQLTDEELVALAAETARDMRGSCMWCCADLFEELAVRLVRKNELQLAAGAMENPETERAIGRPAISPKTRGLSRLEPCTCRTAKHREKYDHEMSAEKRLGPERQATTRYSVDGVERHAIDLMRNEE